MRKMITVLLVSIVGINGFAGKNGVIDHLETDDTDQSFSFA